MGTEQPAIRVGLPVRITTTGQMGVALRHPFIESGHARPWVVYLDAVALIEGKVGVTVQTREVIVDEQHLEPAP